MSKAGNLEYGVIAKIQMPIDMRAMVEILQTFAKYYPGCVVPRSLIGANYLVIKEKEPDKTAGLKAGKFALAIFRKKSDTVQR